MPPLASSMLKSYYIETPNATADRVRLRFKHAPPDRLAACARLRIKPDRPLGRPRKIGKHGSKASNKRETTREITRVNELQSSTISPASALHRNHRLTKARLEQFNLGGFLKKIDFVGAHPIRGPEMKTSKKSAIRN